MGAWGDLTSPLRKAPSAPGVPAYTPDRYFAQGDANGVGAGAGTVMGRGADQLAYTALQKYMARSPGYTDEEQKAMYDQPADQMKLQEQGALRRLNQGAAGAGSFGGGGNQAGRGSIIGGGIVARAGLKQNVMVQAAQAAMEDRIRQIQAASDYANSHIAGTTANVGAQNAYGLSKAQLETQQWQTQLNQYNRQRDTVHQLASKIVGAAAGCWVAEAIFGKESAETEAARFYVNNLAPKEFRDWYMENGQELAAIVDDDPDLKAVLRPLFLEFGRIALEHVWRVQRGAAAAERTA